MNRSVEVVSTFLTKHEIRMNQVFGTDSETLARREEGALMTAQLEAVIKGEREIKKTFTHPRSGSYVFVLEGEERVSFVLSPTPPVYRPTPSAHHPRRSFI